MAAGEAALTAWRRSVVQTRNGKGIGYGMTSDGVMVQVHRGPPPVEEWTEMVEAIRQDRDALIGIVIRAMTSEGPSATQRKQVAAVAASFPESFAKAQISAGNPLPTEGTVSEPAVTLMRICERVIPTTGGEQIEVDGQPPPSPSGAGVFE